MCASTGFILLNDAVFTNLIAVDHVVTVAVEEQELRGVPIVSPKGTVLNCNTSHDEIRPNS
jgi:hypothetical protein